MKFILFILLLIFMIDHQSANKNESQRYLNFECHTHSTYADGIGESPNFQVAVNIAMTKCVDATPHGYICFLDWCGKRVKK